MCLVFVHGLSGSSRWWQKVTPLLGDRPARSLDLPRFGRDFRPHGLVSWLAEEVTRDAPVVLVGHSLGGLVCASLAVERPELVEALVLVAPVGAPVSRSLRAYAAGLAHTFVRARPGLLRTIAGDALRAGPEALVLGARFATTERFAGRIGAPTLLIWGARDNLIPASHGAEWQAAIPGSRLEVIDGAAHVPMVEMPSAFAERLLQFLDDLDNRVRV